ncbi:MAG TPA: DUF5818 domain-containing protein [Pyrinomonadaceae bacterium]|nr:DUF5818 domain-containing protein [Pyrinomonadaceae bacterium]
MRTLVLKLALILIAVGAASAVTVSGTAHNSNNPTPEISVVGYISDSSCGLKHMPGMGDDKSCTLMCVKGGSKFVLADGHHRVVYRLDKAGQEKAREFAGQKVKVTGVVTGKTIKVTAIEAAS